MSLDQNDLRQIEELIKKHRPTIDSHMGAGFITFLFLLFLDGCFKSCGY